MRGRLESKMTKSLDDSKLKLKDLPLVTLPIDDALFFWYESLRRTVIMIMRRQSLTLSPWLAQQVEPDEGLVGL